MLNRLIKNIEIIKRIVLLFIVSLVADQLYSQSGFNGLDMKMGNLYRLSDAKTRSISPENFTGEKGKGDMAIPDPDGTYNANRRFELYRWHIVDPVRFEKDLRITIQDLGWRYGGGTFCKNPIFFRLHPGTRLNLFKISQTAGMGRTGSKINQIIIKWKTKINTKKLK